MVPKVWANSSAYPKVSYFFYKIENHISLENDEFDSFEVILSLKTMIDWILFFEPPMKREVAFSVVV